MTANKLNKDQIQKLVLSLLGLVALIYVYFAFFLGPLNKSRDAASLKIQELERKLGSSKTEIARAASLERQAASATTQFAALKALNPEGAPIAWFPPRIRTFFANHQIDKASARLESSSDLTEKELEAWMTYVWAIDLPQANFVTVGKAIAELENTEPLLAIHKINIQTSAETPELQTVALSASTTMLR